MTTTPANSTESATALWLRLLCVLAAHGRRHKRVFAGGLAAAVAVVALRLMLPWPLKALLDPWLSAADSGGAAAETAGDANLRSMAVLAVAFLALVLGLGLADFLERLQFARFAIGMVRDLRATAFAAVRSARGRVASGDTVARLVGDTARIKAGTKGFLVHVAPNGVLLLGVSAVLVWVYVPLGLVFAAASLLLMIVTTLGAAAMYRRASRYRRKEGEMADLIQRALDRKDEEGAFAQLNRASGSEEASITRIQGITTWCAHGIFGAAVLATIILGAEAVLDGRLEPGALVTLGMYILVIRAPIIQLTRQGARTGKILACTDRVVSLIGTAEAQHVERPRQLQSSVQLDDVRFRGRRSLGRPRRIRVDHLSIPVREKLAVVGPPASGKTSFLRLLAGIDAPRRGQVLWDDVDVTGVRLIGDASPPAAFSPAQPAWRRARLRKVLFPDGDPSSVDRAEELLAAVGLKRLLRRFPSGLNTKLIAASLAASERRRIGAVRAVLTGAPLLLLDEPVTGFGRRQSDRVLKALLNAAADATVVVTLSRPVCLDLFDRVIVLRRGRIAFDGKPAEWERQDPRKTLSLGRKKGDGCGSSSCDPRRRTG